MGEFADLAMQQAMEMHLDGEIDYAPPLYNSARYTGRTCRQCHYHGLVWKQFPQGWRLVYPPGHPHEGKIHACERTSK